MPVDGSPDQDDIYDGQVEPYEVLEHSVFPFSEFSPQVFFPQDLKRDPFLFFEDGLVCGQSSLAFSSIASF